MINDEEAEEIASTLNEDQVKLVPWIVEKAISGMILAPTDEEVQRWIREGFDFALWKEQLE